MQEASLPKGTEITCPACARVMVRARVEIYRGDTIGPAFFEAVEYFPTKGANAICPYDGTAWGAMKVHTKEGWR